MIFETLWVHATAEIIISNTIVMTRNIKKKYYFTHLTRNGLLFDYEHVERNKTRME